VNPNKLIPRFLVPLALILACGIHLTGKRPNVLMLTADDLGWDSLGCMGNPLPGLTPNLDRLAGQGLLIKRAYVSTPICGPSRQTLYTGLHPQSSGFLGHGVQPPAWWRAEGRTTQRRSITSLLLDAGYLTGMIGKHGSEWCRFSLPAHGQNHQTGMGRDPARFLAFARTFLKRAKSENKPFFLAANAHDPHRHWAGHRDETQGWVEAMMGDEPWTPFPNGKPYPDPLSQFRPADCPVPPAYPDHPVVRKTLATYYDSVHRMDQVIGSLLRALRESGMEKNTLVLFLSDHGLAWDLSKWSLYPSGVRTPLILRWPASLKPGQVNEDSVVSAVDLAPTLAELCGLDPMTGTDGLSFACLLRGEQRAWPRTEAFSCFNYMNNHPDIDQRKPDFDPELARRFDQYRPSRALNGGRFSYLWNGWADGNLTLPRTMLGEFHRMLDQGELEDSELRTFIEKRTVEELYDMRNDPACRNNLAGETEFRKTLSGFRNRMLQLMERTGDHEFKNFRKFLTRKD
jgi:N-sulfoglucosamine sulfohydrolase